MFDLAIVGVGATAVSLLKQLEYEILVTGIPAPRIALFCPAEFFARGKAFGDSSHIHRVNTPSDMLGISSHEPMSFHNWMLKRTRKHELYPTRLVYSDFLKETYQKIIDSSVFYHEEFHSNVNAIRSHGEYYELTTDNHDFVEAKEVVMCLGSLHGSLFKNNITRRRGFIDHHRKFDIITDGPVLVAGSGLTAVDILRSLSTNHNREIHLFSRHGYAPTCLTSKNTYTPRMISLNNLIKTEKNKISLSTFLNMLNLERDHFPDNSEVDQALHILNKKGLAQYFDYLMERSSSANLPYQDTIFSLRNYMHIVWRLMPIEDRVTFNLDHLSSWAVWRHPIPYEVIAELANIAKEGRFYIHKTHNLPLWENGFFSIEDHTGRKIKSPYMVDGTGGSNRLETIDSPLIYNLLQQNLIEPHPCGGMNIDPLTYQCRVKGKPVYNFYNIGPLSKGALFSTTGFWFNAYCAGQWAKKYAVRMSHKSLTTV